MSAPRLASVGQVTGPAVVPGYDPAAHGTGIVHLGCGAFHRAHQAVMTDAALARAGGDWRIIGVSLRSPRRAGELNAQNGLYTVIERGADAPVARVVGSIARVIAADAEAALAALRDPAIRVVTLTVTEKGYGMDLGAGLPDAGDPVVARDLAAPENPRGVLGLLTEALRRRQASGAPPLAILSCDNLPGNGRRLRDGVVGIARMSGQEALADWIAASIGFPSSMVDRITPAPTQATRDAALALTGCEDRAAVETEPFCQWVIEDDFPSGRPAWDAGGAMFVADVTPYERMKLTMLNGSHSLLAYAGHLLGCRHVRDVMRDPDLRALVGLHLSAAAGVLPALPGVDFDHYARALEARFANPAIAHETFQIATDGTQKLPQRIFAPAMAALEQGQDVRPFAFAAAMWMRFCLGRRDDGAAYALPDPRADELSRAIAGSDPQAAALSGALHALPNLIPGALATNAMWRSAVEDCLAGALTKGCRAAVQNEIRKEGPRRASA